ncbi:site-specific tyrosine recombinase XerD [Wandonia haliotis]|uniref:Tyrosine recombinase XerC n=1 Tax=Wandonia haliotis TaxID=574963 RepID=A0ABN1MN71_9FLAO
MSNWNTYLKNFESYLKIEKGLSENSISAYREDVKKLWEYAEPLEKSPEQLQLSDLKLFAGELFDLGLAARSQARIISGIKQFFDFLVLENTIETSPAELLEAPRIGRKLPEVLTIEEIDQLQAAIDLSKQEGHRNKAILETLYSCGLRVSELCDLKLSNLYFEEGFVRVIGKGNKERLVPVSPSVEKEINLYYDSMRNHISIALGYEDFVFLNRRGKQLTRVMIFTIIKNLAESIGLRKNISPHTFRHSFATHLIEGGANLRAIQDMLGHESIITTEIYTHISQTAQRDAILLYHPRNKR